MQMKTYPKTFFIKENLGILLDFTAPNSMDFSHGKNKPEHHLQGLPCLTIPLNVPVHNLSYFRQTVLFSVPADCPHSVWFRQGLTYVWRKENKIPFRARD